MINKEFSPSFWFPSKLSEWIKSLESVFLNLSEGAPKLTMTSCIVVEFNVISTDCNPFL